MLEITKKQFRLLVVAQFVLLVVTIVFSVVLESHFMPTEIQTFVDSQYSAHMSIFEVTFGIIAVVVSVWSIQNMYALYNFNKYARKNYTIILCISVFLSLVFPLKVVASLGFEHTFEYVHLLFEGVTLALLYSSNIATYFENTPETSGVADA